MSNITPEYLVRIAPRLRAARESAGLSIGQAAKQTSITALKISQYENGTVCIEYVTSDELETMLDAYGISQADLDAPSMKFIPDKDMLRMIKAGLISEATFSRWLCIDRQLGKPPRGGK